MNDKRKKELLESLMDDLKCWMNRKTRGGSVCFTGISFYNKLKEIENAHTK